MCSLALPESPIMETEQKQKLTAFQEQVFFYHKNRAKTERFHLQTEQNRIFHFPLCNRNQNQDRVLEFLEHHFPLMSRTLFF